MNTCPNRIKLIYKDGIDALYRFVDSKNKKIGNKDVVVLLKWFKIMKHKERTLYLYHSVIILMNNIQPIKIELDDKYLFTIKQKIVNQSDKK